jgi:hypothetical protein
MGTWEEEGGVGGCRTETRNGVTRSNGGVRLGRGVIYYSIMYFSCVRAFLSVCPPA